MATTTNAGTTPQARTQIREILSDMEGNVFDAEALQALLWHASLSPNMIEPNTLRTFAILANRQFQRLKAHHESLEELALSGL